MKTKQQSKKGNKKTGHEAGKSEGKKRASKIMTGIEKDKNEEGKSMYNKKDTLQIL